ncbi:hypothetical protein [Nocardia puris]|uniref:hypothetical protein n=1 Tax=Nocardia puris TaxID=208602 RepID=UPI002E1B1CA9
MAREYAQIRLAIWNDDDFRALSPAAQHLYFMLLTSPTMTYCGVADWRPGRTVANAGAWTVSQLRAAAEELASGLYVVIDESTEEVLVRSYIRHDGLMKNPKTAVSMTIAFAGTASPVLRGVIVHELHRLREREPNLGSWALEKVGEVMARKAIDPKGFPLPFEVGYGVDQGPDYPLDHPQGLPLDHPVAFGEAQGVGLPQGFLPAPAPAPLTSSIGGYVTGVRHVPEPLPPADAPPPKFHSEHPGAHVADCAECGITAERYEAWLRGRLAATEPPRFCPRHPGGTSDPCHDCRTLRELHERWTASRKRAADATRAAERKAKSEIERRAVEACSLCDDDGYRGTTLCTHEPPRTRPTLREQFEALRAETAQPATEPEDSHA